MKSHSSLLIRDGTNNFNVIRIGMAILVVWSHSFALYFGSERTEPISTITNGVFNAGNLAVLVFFIVSGFLITQSFERSRDPWRYLKKRIARIHPGYLVATSICAFVILPVYAGTKYSPVEIIKTLGLNVLLRNFFVIPQPFLLNPQRALNGSLWSIPFEFWCYLGVMALGLCGLLSLRRRHATLALFIAIVAVHAWLEATGKKPGGYYIGYVIGWIYEWFVVLPSFLAGMLAYLYRDRLPRHAAIAALLVLLLIGATHFPIGIRGRLAFNAVIFPVAVSYVTLYVAFSGRTLDGARYGDFSYGAYLYAFPIQQLLIATFSLPFYVFVILSMVLSMSAGIISWHSVERWFHKRTNSRILDRKPTQLSVTELKDVSVLLGK